MTVNVDITALGAQKLYPAMIWLLTRTVNEIPEFRMALVDGVLGVYDDMHPAYTVFNKESKTFSGIWTEFDPNYSAFLAAYEPRQRAVFSRRVLCAQAQHPAQLLQCIHDAVGNVHRSESQSL